MILKEPVYEDGIIPMQRDYTLGIIINSTKFQVWESKEKTNIAENMELPARYDKVIKLGIPTLMYSKKFYVAAKTKNQN